MTANQQELLEKAKVAAVKNGLVLVDISPRRTIVVEIFSTGCGAIGDGVYAHMTGKVVCGPTTFEVCRQYVADNTDPL